ncbi:hypothetical protein [Primorskyibacter sp. 2E233]|uniref:hypothetical protein n=1 Tax=Primorskyibacter sp. 2E233 TaxID=3413431 RepID=UPI003BF30ED0
MQITKEFDDTAAWLKALTKGLPVAIMPNSLAAEVLGESSNAISKKVKKGDVAVISIGKNRYISADYVHDLVDKGIQRKALIIKGLERVARNGSTIFYGELMEMADMNWKSPPDRAKIGAILGKISRESYEEDGILLSSLVHRKGPEPTSPGPGYITLIEGMSDDYDDPDLYDEDDLDAVIGRHMEAVWEHYQAQ